ncbi:MAG: hypothetical protein RLZZ77_19, partial [Bacteroidota bacterium]
MPSSLIKALFISILLLFVGGSSLLSQVQIGKNVDYINPRKFKIAGITVLGAKQSDVQAIKLFSGLQEGQEIMIPGEDISEAIRKLWKQRLFADISISIAEVRGDDVFLVIGIEELQRLGSFTFDGIKKSEADNLREKLDIRTGIIVTENLKTKSINIIKNYYVEKGYFNSKIEIFEEKDPILADGLRLIFKIDRGNKVKIEEIVLNGATSIPTGKIYRAMKETKQRKWWRVFKASKYIEENYIDDKSKIIDKYNKEGYRNAKIVSDSIYVLSPSRIGIRLNIDEGKKFYFRNINFVGNTKYTTGALDSVLNIQKGDLYNLELLQTRLSFNQNGRDISSLYTDDGYLNFYAYPVETLVPEDSIDVEIRMNEGKQYRIGVVTVTGNTKTNDHVIFREIRTRPGDLFNRSDLIRSQRELAALNYFNPEAFDIRTNPRADEGLVDLEYVVEEKPSDQIELSGGWGGNRVVGSLGLTFNNFSMRNFFKKGAWSPLPTGDGQRLSLRAQTNGAFFQSYNISFTEPWFGGKKPNSLS